MNKTAKKVTRILLIFFTGVLILLAGGIIYENYCFKYKYIPSENIYTQVANYIEPETALLNDGFEVCNEKRIFDYYNPEKATYTKGKKTLREFILSNYKNEGYSDSGYLNIRFVINCKGEAGRYVIHQNNLDLEPTVFSEKMVDQLFNLTTQLKEWTPNFLYDEKRDSYMYLSYRIENGEITEILP